MYEGMTLEQLKTLRQDMIAQSQNLQPMPPPGFSGQYSNDPFMDRLISLDREIDRRTAVKAL